MIIICHVYTFLNNNQIIFIDFVNSYIFFIYINCRNFVFSGEFTLYVSDLPGELNKVCKIINNFFIITSMYNY